jgi:uncharacterized protein
VSGYLLDVNALIALLDPTHAHHDRAHEWFAGPGKEDWISSPTTENGAVRVVSHPKYSNAQPAPTVLESLESLTLVGRHRFAPDAVSLLDSDVVRVNLLSSSQVTDTYLLQLAVSLGARLATFDTRIVTTAVPHAKDAVFLIPRGETRTPPPRPGFGPGADRLTSTGSPLRSRRRGRRAAPPRGAPGGR